MDFFIQYQHELNDWQHRLEVFTAKLKTHEDEIKNEMRRELERLNAFYNLSYNTLAAYMQEIVIPGDNKKRKFSCESAQFVADQLGDKRAYKNVKRKKKFKISLQDFFVLREAIDQILKEEKSLLLYEVRLDQPPKRNAGNKKKSVPLDLRELVGKFLKGNKSIDERVKVFSSIYAGNSNELTMKPSECIDLGIYLMEVLKFECERIASYKKKNSDFKVKQYLIGSLERYQKDIGANEYEKAG